MTRPIRSFPIVDYSEEYGSLMQFNKNKSVFIHQWYPFVEGYSRDFICTVLNELNYTPRQALDMFSGSGTTPLELQYLGIPCTSIEVSPFMHLLSTVKLQRDYTVSQFDKAVTNFTESLFSYRGEIRNDIPPPLYQTIEPKSGLDSYAFNKAVMTALLKIKLAIRSIKNPKYQNLFKVVFASILLDVSNLYRNGKCLSYKKEWKSKRPKEDTVINKFFEKLQNVIRPDIEQIEFFNSSSIGRIPENNGTCYYGDAREKIKSLPDRAIDLVITSPPYLNSRDYTDIYMMELWMLDLVDDYPAVRTLRKNTLRSHVQVRHGEIDCLDIQRLKTALRRIDRNKENHWDRGISGMIKGYFQDMDGLFENLKPKMEKGKYVYFNIANSAYYGVEIKVDEIISEIAENKGFKVKEIRQARMLKPSVQQKEKIKGLRESVIVMHA